MAVDMQALGQQAKAAAFVLRKLDTAAKNDALRAVADEIDARRDAILAANVADMEDGRAAGLTSALLDRLNTELGKTLVMVTHDAQCAAVAHRVLHLEKGRLADAPPREYAGADAVLANAPAAAPLA